MIFSVLDLLSCIDSHSKVLLVKLTSYEFISHISGIQMANIDIYMREKIASVFDKGMYLVE
jgi:hypothetical protein